MVSDGKGPITPRDRRGNRYISTFIDFYSSFVAVFLAKHKDVAMLKFKEFLAYFERRFNCKILVLRTDGGKEYAQVDEFCAEIGIERQLTQPHTPASNGKAERMNRTLMNTARTMLFSSGLATHFWADAIEYAAYTICRLPTSSNEGH